MNFWSCRIAVAAAGVAWVSMAAAQELTPERGQADRAKRPEPTGERVEHLVRMLDNPRITTALGLTEAQKALSKEASVAHQKKMISIRAELETAAVEQAKLLADETTDLKALMNAVEKTGKVRTEMAKLQVRHLIEIRGMLTADQRAKLRDIMRKFHERRGEERASRRQQSEEAKK